MLRLSLVDELDRVFVRVYGRLLRVNSLEEGREQLPILGGKQFIWQKLSVN